MRGLEGRLRRLEAPRVEAERLGAEILALLDELVDSRDTSPEWAAEVDAFLVEFAADVDRAVTALPARSAR